MNTPLGLVRLHIDRRAVPADWAKLLACAISSEQTAWTAVGGSHGVQRMEVNGLP